MSGLLMIGSRGGGVSGLLVMFVEVIELVWLLQVAVTLENLNTDTRGGKNRPS